MTDIEKYHVVLSPIIRSGYEPDLVVRSFADIFKIPLDKAKNIVGTRKILKKDVSENKAKQYQHKLKSIGLDVILVKAGETQDKVKLSQVTRPKKDILELVPIDEKQANEPADPAITSTNAIVCPKCQLEQSKSDQCSGCGVFFHKVNQTELDNQSASHAPTAKSQQTATSGQSGYSVERDSSDLKMLMVPAITALLGALLWKFIAVTFNYELGLIAWLIGGAIGFSAATIGAKGHNTATLCAVLALLAIMGGKYMATSSLISDAMAAVSGGDEVEGVSLKTVFEEVKLDAKQFSETVSDEKSLRKFMVERGYSESTNPELVTYEEIESFRENKQPDLEEMIDNPQSFDDWKNNTLTQELEDLSAFDVMLGNLGLLDFLFLFLGVGTAFRLGLGEEQ